MAQSTAIRPLAFPQSSHISSKYKRRIDDSDISPYPSDNETPAYCRRSGASDNSYRAIRSSPQPCTAVSKSSLKLHIRPRSYLPDEEDEEAYPSHYSHAQENRRPSHLQSSRHAHRPSITPITPTTAKKLAELQLRTPSSDRSPVREHGRSVEEQISEVRAALRRVEADRQKLRDQIEAEKVDRYKAERELAEARKENRRLTARLEELLRSPSLRSPLSARSDDGWGYSMYDHKVDGRWQ